MNTASALPRLLLLEPDPMLRHTVALTARSTGLAEVIEAASLGSAQELLRSTSLTGLILSLGTDDSELVLIEQVRNSQAPGHADVKVAVMVDQCDTPLAQRMQAAGVSQIILRPFKVKTLLRTVQLMAAA